MSCLKKSSSVQKEAPNCWERTRKNTVWPLWVCGESLRKCQHWRSSEQRWAPSSGPPLGAEGSAQQWTAVSQCALIHYNWSHTAPDPAQTRSETSVQKHVRTASIKQSGNTFISGWYSSACTRILANFRSFTPRTVNRNKNQLAAGICVTWNITNKIRDIGIYVTVCETIPVWGSPQYSWCLEHSAGPPGDLHQSAWAPQTP